MEFPIRTSERVLHNTSSAVNEKIEQKTQASIRAAQIGGPEAIDRRLADLDREWDIERCLETGASSLSVIGLILGKKVNPKWYLLPAGVAGFLLQHALQGWCPPLPVFRRLGIRTADEINRERFALKALRGDFAGLEEKDRENAVEESFNATRH